MLGLKLNHVSKRGHRMLLANYHGFLILLMLRKIRDDFWDGFKWLVERVQDESIHVVKTLWLKMVNIEHVGYHLWQWFIQVLRIYFFSLQVYVFTHPPNITREELGHSVIGCGRTSGHGCTRTTPSREQSLAVASTKSSQMARFMGPPWGPPGSCRPQMGPMNLAIRGST